MQLAAAGLVCAWLMGQTGATPPPNQTPTKPSQSAGASTKAAPPGEAELPVPVPAAATPVTPGTEAAPPPSELKTRLDRVRAENAALPVQAKIEVQNQMGKRFRLVAASLVIDGNPALDQELPKGQDKNQQLSFKNRPISVLLPAGDHILTATLTFEGRNVGPFTYMDDTRYRVESTIPFSTSHLEGPKTIQVVASERKGANIPLEKKPMLTLNAGQATPTESNTQTVERPAPPPRQPTMPMVESPPLPGFTPARTTTPP
jgi:hypothetical protein